MNNAVLLIISLAAALGGNVVKKQYTDKKSNGFSGFFNFNAVSCAVATLVLPLWGGIGSVSWFTVLLGIVFGVVTALQGITNLFALESGPLSYTTVIISFSTLIPALLGIAFFGEEAGLVADSRNCSDAYKFFGGYREKERRKTNESEMDCTVRRCVYRDERDRRIAKGTSKFRV